MFNPDFNPFDHLQQLHIASRNHDQTIEHLDKQQQELARLLEMMANQVKYLTDALNGLQQQNKILLHRLYLLEETDD
jgi:prefoldin subunit 5